MEDLKRIKRLSKREPKELRDFFKIDIGTQMEIIGTDAGILIRFPEYEIKKIKEDDAHG